MIRNARADAIVVMEQAVIHAVASCVQLMPCIARYGPSGGNGQFMGVQRKKSPVKSFPKGSHLFGGDERQAGTTTITVYRYTRAANLRLPIPPTRVAGGSTRTEGPGTTVSSLRWCLTPVGSLRLKGVTDRAAEGPVVSK